jgi:hypothetical protein
LDGSNSGGISDPRSTISGFAYPAPEEINPLA